MMEESGRPLTAKEKRQEQLKRWINSATDVESPVIQNFKPKVKFNDGAVFLAACSSGDLEEVQVLIDKGADINFANVDGLTALHQACIDGNVEVVEFLVERGVEIDQEDNEGWTPLHAAASCGFMDIAKYLVENGANVAAVNSEGEVPLDIAEEDDMIDFLQKEIDKQGLDIERARNEEREQMTVDATQQLNAVRNGEKPSIYRHPKSGATSLHVAAAKGYINVLKILLQAGMDVNVRDNDGWTPLHAASHWSQKEAAKLLADKYADFNARSKLGQTACDVADEDMLEYLEDLKEDQEKNRLESKEGDLIEPPSPTIQHTSIQSITRETKYIEKSSSGDRYTASTEKEMNVRNSSIGNNINHQEEDSCSSDEDANSSSSSEVAPSKTIEKMQKDTDKKFDEAFNQNSSFKVGRTGSSNNVSLRNVESETTQLRQSSSGSNVSSSTGFAGRRTTRPASLHISSNQVKDTRPPIMSAVELSSNRPMAAAQPIQASKSNGPTPGTPTERNSGIKEGAPKTWRSGLRKTGSFDDKMRPLQRGTLGSSSRASDNERSLLSKSSEETTNSSGGIQTARVAPILDARISDKSKRSNDEDTSTHFSFQKSGSFHRYGADSYRGSSTAPITFRRSSDSSTSKADNTTSTSPAATSSSTAAPSASFAIGESRLDRRRSHLQPVRDEEAEAQRKARSRRERQSRRSTQGVTLDVYEEAKRHIDHMKQERENNASNIAASRKADSSDGANQDGAHIPHNDSNSLLHRRIGVTTPTSTVGNRGGTVTLPSSYIPSNERVGNTAKTGPINSSANVPSINIVDSGNDVNKQNTEEGNNTDEDKNSLLTANQSSNAKKTTAQQRRRQRKERRSTGLPGLRVTDTGADVGSDDDGKSENDNFESTKAERLRATASRYDSSSTDRYNRQRGGAKTSDSDGSRYGIDRSEDKDYKKLYDEQLEENKRLKNELADARKEIADLQERLNRAEDSVVQRKAVEAEKREKRALERKLAEVEKELMAHNELKTDNQRLKDENGALIRVISKLSK